MTSSLRIIIFVAAFLFTAIVLSALKKKKINTKLSLLWLFACVILMLSSVFSKAVICISEMLGFEEAVNMVFFLGVLALLAICFYLCTVISKQQRIITVIIQEVSLLNKRLNDGQSEKE